MTINNISFGQITKVNSPIQIAKQLVDTANKEHRNSFFSNFKNRKIDAQIHSTFSDLAAGKAVMYTDKENNIFIFSGQDAIKYREINELHEKNAAQVASYYAAFPSGGMHIQLEEEQYRSQVSDLISNCTDVKEAQISFDSKRNKLVSIELIG